AGMPVEERARLGEDRRLAGSHRGGERAYVDQLGVDVGRDVGSGRIDGEVRASIAEAEEDQRGASIDLVAPLRHGLPVERRYRRAASERLEIAQRQQARLGIAEQRGESLTGIAPRSG